MTAMKVFRLWLALTRLVLAGRGRYDVYLHLDDDAVSDDTAHEINRLNWVPWRADWVGGEDRFVSIVGTPERES
jgi:hypothetical protein